MRIAVNTRLLLKDKLEGIGWFTYETMKRITQWHKEHEFIFLFDRKWDDEFIFSENITPVRLFPPSRHPVLWYWWFECAVPKILREYQVDAFLSPDGYLSMRTRVPSVAVMHDINFWHFPKDLPRLTAGYYKFFFPRYAKKAARIATVSQYSKKDIAKSFNVTEDKIDVVYNGVNTILKPISASEQTKVREQYTKGQPFFLFIGSLHPRKNIERLLKAYEQFRLWCDCNVKLVIVGEAMFKTSGIKTTYKNHQFSNDIIFTGRLKAEHLQRLFPAALALTFVPYFEGFGIPLVEAMQCDVPVLTSNLTSLPEIAGDAAITVNPYAVNDIAKGMLQIATDSDLRDKLIRKGRMQKHYFSWDKTARSLWETIEKVTNHAKRTD